MNRTENPPAEGNAAPECEHEEIRFLVALDNRRRKRCIKCGRIRNLTAQERLEWLLE